MLYGRKLSVQDTIKGKSLEEEGKEIKVYGKKKV